MDGIYEARNTVTNIYEKSYIIDLQTQRIGSHEDADLLITALLQGDLGQKIIENPHKLSSFRDLNNGSFYDILGEKTFEEHIGLFYNEDIGIDNIAPGVDDVNKTRKRIITYIYIP